MVLNKRTVRWLFVDDTAEGSNEQLPRLVDEEDNRLRHLHPAALCANTAISQALQMRPDVALLDLLLPLRLGEDRRHEHGVGCALTIRKESRGAIQVLIFSNSPPEPKLAESRAQIACLAEAGVLGYLDKSAGYHDIAQALIQASEGTPAFKPGWVYQLWQECLKPWPHPCFAGLDPLNASEHETLVLLATVGGKNMDIARMRGDVGLHAVAANITSACEKLQIPGQGAGRRSSLAIWAINNCPIVQERLARNRRGLLI